MKLEIFQDDYNPREEENVTTMVCFHKRYSLGDKHPYKSHDYNGWEEVKKQLIKDGAVLILPLYLYDHSGITMNTTGFHCPWDSGQVGFITMNRDQIEYVFLTRRVTQKVRERALDLMVREVKTYDDYLTGNVWAFTITDDDGEVVDSCGGFVGDHKESGILEYIPSELHSQVV